MERASDWGWSSVRAHLAGEDDGLVAVKPVLDRFPDFAGMLEIEPTTVEMNALRRAETSGRPLGSKAWVDALGVEMAKRGRKAK